MMAVIGFRLRPSEQDRAAVLRQAIGYIWVPPPENPLGLEHTVRFGPSATQGKSTLLMIARWKTPPGHGGPPPGDSIVPALESISAVPKPLPEGRTLQYKVLDTDKPRRIVSSGRHPWILLHHRQSSLSALPSPTPPAFGNAAVFTTTLFSPPLPPSGSLLLGC